MRSSSSALREQRAARRAALAGGQPIQYRLPKPANETTAPEVVIAKPTEPEDHYDDYTPMVRGVLRAATTLFLGQSLSAILIANYLGAQLQIRFWFGFIPHVAILAARDLFVSILTWSTAFAVAITCLAVLSGLVRHRNEQKLLDGWASGLFMAGILLILQYVRHLLDPPAIDGWVLAQAAAGVVAAAVIFLGFRPEAERLTERQSSGSEPRTARTREAMRTKPRNPREGLKR